MAQGKKITTSFLIGIFVIAGLAILVGFIMWMGATQFLKDYDYYVTYFSESIDGLENGSSVKYLGVPCGLVQNIAIAPDGKLVQVVLKIQPDVDITADMVCKLEMAGLAGGKYVQLVTAQQGTPINDFQLDFRLPYPLLHSAPSQIDELVSSAGSIVSDLKNFRWNEVSNELVGTLEGANKIINNADLNGIISDLRTTTQSISKLAQQLQTENLSSNVEDITASIAKTSQELEKFSANLNLKLNDINVPKYMDLMYSDFHGTLLQANKAIDAVTAKFQSSILGVNMLMEDLNQTNRYLQQTLRNINESPYMFLTKPPKPDEIDE